MRKNKKILREGMKNIQQYSINKGGKRNSRMEMRDKKAFKGG